MKVLSTEQMTKLKELGVDTSKASMCYVFFESDGNKYEKLVVHNEDCYEFSSLNPIPTFTLQDVVELLPKVIIKEGLYLHLNISITYSKWYCFEYSFCNGSQFNSFISRENILDAAYQMLIWVIENNYLKTK